MSLIYRGPATSPCTQSACAVHALSTRWGAGVHPRGVTDRDPIQQCHGVTIHLTRQAATGRRACTAGNHTAPAGKPTIPEASLIGSTFSTTATDGVNDRGPIQQIRGVPTHFTRQGATRTTPTSPKQKRHSDPVPTNDFDKSSIGPAATHTNPSPLAHSAAHRLCELREKSTAEGLRPALARASVGPRSGPERSSGQSGLQAFRG